MSLPETLAAARPTATGLIATIPDNWMQGRTSYGGLSAALALEAARKSAPDLPPLRSAQVSFVGPLAGEIEVTTRLLRRGRNASWITAEVTSEAGVGLVATFVFMGPIESSLHLNEMPLLPGIMPAEDAVPLPPNVGPGFIDNFDRRFALPREAQRDGEICWWLRVKDRAGLDPMVEAMLIGDGLPPGVMFLLGGRVAVSSMTWIVNLLTPEPTSSDGWYMLRAAGNYAENGCSSQDMAIWDSSGRPIAAGMQAIALFG